MKAIEGMRLHPKVGCIDLTKRCAKMRLTMKRIMTPAAAKILAAIVKLALSWRVDQTMRRTSAILRAMQKPARSTEGRNLCPRALFRRKMVILRTNPLRKKTIKTAQIGTSTFTVGVKPRRAVTGA